MNRRIASVFMILASCCLATGTQATGVLVAGEPASRPNILFAIADDASFPHFGAYGCEWVKTPAFDQVARQGILFTRAYTPNAKCAPSRSSILTGRYSWQLEEGANHWCEFPAKFRVFPEVLQDHGYVCGMTGKGWGPGVARDSQGVRRELAGTPYQQLRMQPPARAISPTDYAGNFAAFLEDVDRGKTDARLEEANSPWCFWYGGYEPHRGYEYGAGIKKGGKSLDDIPEVPGIWPDTEEVRTDMLDYAYEIEYFDQHLGRMLKLLDERGELDRTIVIVTADNGMPFPRVKGQEYEWSNHLPLAIMWPDGIANPGRSVDALVNFIDFAPTLLEVAGVDWAESGMAATEGKSLRAWFDNEDEAASGWREFTLIGKERHDVGRPGDVGYPIRGIVQGDWLLLHNYETSRWPAGNPETGYLNCDASPTKTLILEQRRSGETDRFWNLAFGKRAAVELYDLSKDPNCLENLADRSTHQSVQDQLSETMLAELKRQQDPRVLGRGEIFDEYPYVDPGSHSFYERYFRGDKPSSGWVNKTDFEAEPLEKD